MNVAAFRDQHSMRFGHRASSQTVATPLRSTTSFVNVRMSPVGRRFLSHGGSRRRGAGSADSVITGRVMLKVIIPNGHGRVGRLPLSTHPTAQHL